MGHKRHADESAERQPLAKRFHALDLNQLYSDRLPLQHGAIARSARVSPSTTFAVAPMQLDSNKHKVYIHDLDQELEDGQDERPGKSLSFLSDVDKHVTRLPQEALGSPSESPTGRELVLYSVPSSLSVPAEQDNVRRAIIEARARLRRQRSNEGYEASTIGKSSASDANQNSPTGPQLMWQSLSDPDAMDID